MADYLGNVLIPPQTVEHQAASLACAVEQVREAQRQHGIVDLIVTVERTGNFHRATQRAFREAGWETRIVHPFATKQYRLPADAGNKTDTTDLYAQHRAAVAGFGLCERVLDERFQRLQLHIRHRRDLVEKSSALACQIRDHLHVALPGYAELFSDLLASTAGMAVVRACDSPPKMLAPGVAGWSRLLREQKVRFQTPTLEKIVAWAGQTSPRSLDPTAAWRHALAVDLLDQHQRLAARIEQWEGVIARDLVQTPYVKLLVIPGLNVVSVADFAGEMGPIAHYANANAITGRAGLYPSRYQSDQTDHQGALVRKCNRSLRAALMRIADNLCRFNSHFRGLAGVARAQKTDERAIRVVFAKKFTRLAFAVVAGEQPLRHPCAAQPESILRKLREFHRQHGTPPDVVLADLEAALTQLAPAAQAREAQVVAATLTPKRRGVTALGDLVLAVLAKYRLTADPSSMSPQLVAAEPDVAASSGESDRAKPNNPDQLGTTAPS